MTIESILRESGDFGPAQWLLLALFCLVNVVSAFHYFAQTFINLAPENICDLRNCTSLNVSQLGNDSANPCESFEAPEWTFQTLTVELDWVCGEAWTAATVQSMFFLGSMTGTLILGFLADIVGRLPMMVVANLLAVLGNLLTIYLPPSIWFLSGARFVAGLATDTNFFMMYIIVMEYMRPSMRTTGLNLSIGVWYCIGCMATPWVAMLCGSWRTFLLTISLLTLAIPALAFTVPESAQWLLTRGRVEDAIKCFRKVASVNRKKISQEFITDFKKTTAAVPVTTGSQSSILGLFITPNLRRKTCILIFKTMVLTLCYDAMSRNIEGLGLNPFTMFTITSATIFPSCVIILLLQDRVGRKAVAVVALFLTGLFNFGQGALLIFSGDVASAVAVVSMCGRLAVNVAYNSGTQYAAELIPTQVRGQGLAAIHVIGYAAAFFSPQILFLANTWVATPEVTLGILSIAGSIFCLFLPETLNQTLPATLEDGEAFGENEKFWEFMKRKNKKEQEK